jgi:DNA repair exonuclease SbcCD ATPase subunit
MTMPNERLESLRRTYRARATGIAGQLAQREREIQRRQDVTGRQKRGMLESIRAQAHQRLTDLAAEYAEAQQGVLDKLRRDLYRNPPQVAAGMDWRDAWARAKAIADRHDPKDPQAALREARAAFAVARLADDHTMMRALLMAAELRDWSAIRHAYAAAEPDARTIMAEIEDVSVELADQDTSYQDAAMFQMPPPQPPPPEPSLAVALDHQAHQWGGIPNPTQGNGSEPAATP